MERRHVLKMWHPLTRDWGSGPLLSAYGDCSVKVARLFVEQLDRARYPLSHKMPWVSGKQLSLIRMENGVRTSNTVQRKVMEGNGVPTCLLNKVPLSWVWFDSTAFLNRLYSSMVRTFGC